MGEGGQTYAFHRLPLSKLVRLHPRHLASFRGSCLHPRPLVPSMHSPAPGALAQAPRAIAMEDASGDEDSAADDGHASDTTEDLDIQTMLVTLEDIKVVASSWKCSTSKHTEKVEDIKQLCSRVVSLTAILEDFQQLDRQSRERITTSDFMDAYSNIISSYLELFNSPGKDGKRM